MRKVIAEIAVSLDGFIEGPGGELDWLIFEEEKTYVNEFLSRFEVIFYGRTAYERFGAPVASNTYPAEPAMGDTTFTHMRKYVFSSSLKHVPGNGMVIQNRIREQVMEIKEEEGGDIWLCGGAAIIQTFARLGLIDEYILAVQPVVLGSGKPLFGNSRQRIHLHLLQAEQLSSGVVVLRYRPDTA